MTGRNGSFVLEFTVNIIPGPGNYPHRSPIYELDLRCIIYIFLTSFNITIFDSPDKLKDKHYNYTHDINAIMCI